MCPDCECTVDSSRSLQIPTNLFVYQFLHEDVKLTSYKVNRGTSFSAVFTDAHKRHGLYTVATVMLVFMTAFVVTFLHRLTKRGTTGLLPP